MRIAWIGGMDRSEEAYAHAARRAGHEIEFHKGHVGGRGTEGLRAVIERSDAVVVLTEVNSHGAVGLARRFAKEAERPVMLFRTCGLSRFRTLLEELDAREQAAPAKKAS
jgi:hypothetical protein